MMPPDVRYEVEAGTVPQANIDERNAGRKLIQLGQGLRGRIGRCNLKPFQNQEIGQAVCKVLVVINHQNLSLGGLRAE